MTRKKKLSASKKRKKSKPHKTKKFYRLNKKLISTKHYWAAVRDVWHQFGYHLPGGEKHVEQQLQLRKWISVALSYELAGYNHTHAFSALKKAEKDVRAARLQAAMGSDPVFVLRLLDLNDKLGGAERLFNHPYLQKFYKVTNIPKFNSVKNLQRFLTDWKKIIGRKVRTHTSFEGSLRQQQMLARAEKKKEKKGYLGKR